MSFEFPGSASSRARRADHNSKLETRNSKLKSMIDRYTLPEMGALWSEETKFQKWLDVEIAVCEVHAEMGTISAVTRWSRLRAAPSFLSPALNEIEKTTDHDVIAFTTNLAESIGEAGALRSLRPDFIGCGGYRKCIVAARRVRPRS